MSDLEKWAEDNLLEAMALVAIALFLKRLAFQAYLYYVSLGH